MKSEKEIIEIARQAVSMEASAIEGLVSLINEDFAKVVNEIIRCEGRVVITGIGKSAHIASKIVSTLNSTGTQALFMHAADAVHGDLGMIAPSDIVICLSKSGNTPEIKVLVPLLKTAGNKLVAIVGDINSYLAINADYVLNSTVPSEACPNNLAPTSSSTAQLVIGDALAVALLKCRDFKASDFAKYHPGGALGKKMYLRVSDLFKQNEKPQVATESNIREVILEISSKRLGCTVVENENKLVGIITDGDLRRMLESNIDIANIKAEDIMTKNPQTVEPDLLVSEALDIMKKKNITQLPVIENNKYIGVIHIHDILKEGII